MGPDNDTAYGSSSSCDDMESNECLNDSQKRQELSHQILLNKVGELLISDGQLFFHTYAAHRNID